VQKDTSARTMRTYVCDIVSDEEEPNEDEKQVKSEEGATVQEAGKRLR